MAAYRGVDRQRPVITQAHGTTAGQIAGALTLPAVTTTVPNSMILLCIGNDRDATATNSYNVATNANLTGLAKRMDATTASGVGGGVSLHEGLMATVGNTGTSSVTKLTAHTASAGYTTVALRPARRVYKFS